MPRVVIILLCSVAFLRANAQTDSLTHRVHTLDTVIVSEGRLMRSLQSTSPEHVLQHSDLQRMGVSTMADALHRIPGITLRDYGGAGGMKTVSVRGFGTQHTGVS